jgi:hypothetical protein
VTVDPREALDYLGWVLLWNGGTLPIYVDGELRARITGHGRLPALAQRLDFVDSAQVEVGVAERVGAVPILWTWLESRDQVRRAARFRPTPSFVLRIGKSCRRLALWPLHEPLPYADVEPSNRRLAYALHAPQKTSAPDRLRIPLPATFMRAGRRRPAPVLVTRMVLEDFTAEQVVGRLKAPPAPWVQRMRESGQWR